MARQLLIVEYLCAGFENPAEVPPSMLAEGKAMLTALLEDASRIEATHVTTLWNDRLGGLAMDELTVRRTSSNADASDIWRSALTEADDVCVIAPETDGILRRMCCEAAEAGTNVLNCASRAIEVAGDKWETFLRLSAAEIETVPTQLLEDYLTRPAFDAPKGLVIKPRDGCGSEGIRIVQQPDPLSPAMRPPIQLIAIAPSGGEAPRGYPGEGHTDDLDHWLVQPFLTGQPASLAVIFNNRGELQDALPLALQDLNPDLKYQGGSIPAVRQSPPDPSWLTFLARRVGEAIPGLRGYVGIDLLIQADGSCLVVEINPRLTTSYIGYRALTCINLAERWLSSEARAATEISWSAGGVSFSADGRVCLSG